MTGKNAGRVRNVSILLAESTQIQCQLLSAALRRQPGFQVTSCTAALPVCLTTLQSFSPDVILLGGLAPGTDSTHYEVLRGLHSSNPHIPVVLLLYTYDRDSVITALRAGARGLFCLDAMPFKALCRCIHAVHEGQFWVNTEQLGYVVEALAKSPSVHATAHNGQALLTSREEQVVTLVAEGLGNRQIARELKLTENTVKKALLRIFDKLGISNRVELVLYVLTQRGTEAETSAVTPPPQLAVPAHSFDTAAHKLVATAHVVGSDVA
ncbi:MAG TPA: response regulator transcription factor [Terriglobales bacterium]|nr:response regulator transcription factor [Terriglobales bacterium]